MKRKKILLLVILLFILPIKSSAAQTTEFVPGIDIMFVIDNSLSMQINDPEGMVFEAVKYIATLSEGTQNRIGFVVFNDDIIVEQGLRRIHRVGEFHDTMRELQLAPPLQGTDVGLAMGRALEIMRSDNYRVDFTAMVILSDGDTLLDYINRQRSQEEVEEEWERILEEADFPIFTIQYSELGDDITAGYRHSGVKDDWGPRTGGRNFNATNSEEMMEAISRVYEELTGLTLNLERIVENAEERFEVTIIEPEPIEESWEFPISMEQAILGVIIIGGVLFLLLLIYLIRKLWHKGRNQYFKGSLECYFMVTPEGSEEIPIQSWTSSFLSGRRRNSLYKLLKNVSLIDKLSEAKAVYIKTGIGNSIVIQNQAGVTCYGRGQEIKEREISLRSGEGLYMVFQKGTLELELRVRKGSL